MSQTNEHSYGEGTLTGGNIHPRQDGIIPNEPVNDPVNHPYHYTSGRFEVIDIIEDQLGGDGIRGFCLGNAIKYICRAGKKGGSEEKMIQDLQKAIWYINHYIDTRKTREY